jgi:hypothetical protein
MDEKSLKFCRDAVMCQDACNEIAIVHLLKDAMIHARDNGTGVRSDPAVIAIFFKVYDMLGSPDEKIMYAALKTCENIINQE